MNRLCLPYLRSLGWCSKFLKDTVGSCLFAHSGALCGIKASSEIKAVSPWGFDNHSYQKYLAQPRWTLPANSRLRICFVLLSNMWGRFRDTVKLHIASNCAPPGESEPPVIQIPIRYTLVGCPILLSALSPFGQIINSVGRKLGTANLDESVRHVTVTEATRMNVHLGTRMPGDEPVIRQIKLFNSSSSSKLS